MSEIVLGGDGEARTWNFISARILSGGLGTLNTPEIWLCLRQCWHVEEDRRELTPSLQFRQCFMSTQVCIHTKKTLRVGTLDSYLSTNSTSSDSIHHTLKIIKDVLPPPASVALQFIVCQHECVCLCMYCIHILYKCINTSVEARGGWQVHFSDTPHSPSLLRQVSPWTRNLLFWLNGLTSKPQGSFYLHYPCSTRCQDYRHTATSSLCVYTCCIHTMLGLQAHCYVQLFIGAEDTNP